MADILKEAAPEDFLTCLWKDVGYKDFTREYAKSRNMEPKELKEIWDDYKKEAKNYKTWEEWKKAIEIYRIKLAEANQSKGGITLSTMHRSKGLEWKNVFIKTRTNRRGAEIILCCNDPCQRQSLLNFL